jgi:hypothetical protein
MKVKIINNKGIMIEKKIGMIDLRKYKIIYQIKKKYLIC